MGCRGELDSQDHGDMRVDSGSVHSTDGGYRLEGWMEKTTLSSMVVCGERRDDYTKVVITHIDERNHKAIP